MIDLTLEQRIRDAAHASVDAVAVPELPAALRLVRPVTAPHRARRWLWAAAAAAAVVLALAADGGRVSTAMGLAQKTLAGVRIWLSGGNAAVAVSSFAMVRDPLPADVRHVIDDASFAPVLPTHFPAGTHVAMLMYSPPSRPSTISLRYVNDRTGYHRGLTVVATS